MVCVDDSQRKPSRIAGWAKELFAWQGLLGGLIHYETGRFRSIYQLRITSKFTGIYWTGNRRRRRARVARSLPAPSTPYRVGT